MNFASSSCPSFSTIPESADHWREEDVGALPTGFLLLPLVLDAKALVWLTLLATEATDGLRLSSPVVE